MAKNHLLPLVSYVPPAVAEAIYHNPTVPSAPSVQFFTAAVLFADVSGFTPLAEALAQKGPEGAEALTRVLNTYFSRMITLIERRAGEVVKFSGDAMMVVFPAPAGQMGDAVRRAQEAAEAMQGAMDEFSRLETIAGPVELGMKIGIGVGQVSAFSVGGEQDKWEYVIAGDPLRQVAEAEHSAERGEIILSPEAKGALSAYPSSGYRSVAIDWEMLSENQIKAAEVALRAYIPEIITSRLAAGQSGWLAELRRLTVLFVSVVQGLDYAQSNAIDRLQAFTHAAQTTILRYEGSINKIAVDDKGTILIGLFGAPPFAHEDDPERALRCALDLQGAARAQGLRLAIGVTTGQVFSGPVGSDTRREYTVMGDIVNLAARLMSVAVKALRQEERENQFRDENGIRCDDETYQAAAGRLTFHQLSPVYVKGKARLIQL
ncbi:MAG: adenylate/guanylate cyclase domain-containing protein, partial [Anaerolineae bacterium]